MKFDTFKLSLGRARADDFCAEITIGPAKELGKHSLLRHFAALGAEVALAFALTLELTVPVFAAAAEDSAKHDLAIVRSIMSTPEDKIDFARAKLTFDKLYDPKTDIEASLKQIDAMAQTIKAMAGVSAPSRVRLSALRKYIYDTGSWNRNDPFKYDLSDPLGHKPRNKLLST